MRSLRPKQAPGQPFGPSCTSYPRQRIYGSNQMTSISTRPLAGQVAGMILREAFHQVACHRPDLALSNRSPVYAHDRHDVHTGAGQKAFLKFVPVGQVHRRFGHIMASRSRVIPDKARSAGGVCSRPRRTTNRLLRAPSVSWPSAYRMPSNTPARTALRRAK